MVAALLNSHALVTFDVEYGPIEDKHQTLCSNDQKLVRLKDLLNRRSAATTPECRPRTR